MKLKYKTQFILKTAGQLTESLKDSLRSVFKQLEGNKFYEITINEIGNISKSRYKYYFGHIIATAVDWFNEHGIYQIKDLQTGETNKLDSDTLHEVFKQKYNPEIINLTDKIIIRSGTTTRLSDSQFIDKFQDKILAELANEGMTFLTKDEYFEMLNMGYDSKGISQMQINNF